MTGGATGSTTGGASAEDTILIVLNGEPAMVPAGSTLAAIVGAQGLSPEARGVAVALDGEVVRRAEWGTTAVRAGQRVEVLTAVAGG